MIEKAFLITTKSEQEIKKRLSHIKSALKCEDDFIEVLRNEKNVHDPVKGCFDAHMNAYRKVVNNGYQACLILEDDVFFKKSIGVDALNNMIKGLSFDLFYLGHRPVYKQKTWMKTTERPGVVQVRTNDRHAMILSGQYAKRILKLEWTGKNGDVILRNNASQSFALYPMKAIQTGAVGSKSFSNGFAELINEYIQYSKTEKPFVVFVKKLGLPVYALVVIAQLIWVRLKDM